VEASKENIGMLLDRLSMLAALPNYPKDERILADIARRMCKFLHNRDRNEVVREFRHKEGLDVFPELRIPEIEGPGPNDIDQFFDILSETCEFFPPLIKMRELHERVCRNADGVTAGELLSRYHSVSEGE